MKFGTCEEKFECVLGRTTFDFDSDKEYSRNDLDLRRVSQGKNASGRNVLMVLWNTL